MIQAIQQKVAQKLHPQQQPAQDLVKDQHGNHPLCAQPEIQRFQEQPATSKTTYSFCVININNNNYSTDENKTNTIWKYVFEFFVNFIGKCIRRH